MAVNRRALLRAGITVTAVGATGAVHPLTASAGTATTPTVVEPHIYDTRNWGARPPNGTIQVLSRRPTYIVVHHTAGSNSNDFSLEHAFAISRSIQDFHMDVRGWIDSGQQLTNSRGGFITEGRHRSLEVLTDGTRHVVGANVANHNSEVIGIENEGLYMDVDVTPQLWDSLVQLVAFIAAQYAIPTSRIKGHRDFNATLCPGDVLYARLPELRAAVGGLLGTQVEQPATWPLLRPGDSGHRVLAAQHLLRAHGYAEVPTDGVFATSTEDAVRRFAVDNKVPYEPCYACRHADESGLLGAGSWPLLVPAVRAGESGEAGKAAQVLISARGERIAADRILDTDTWQALLR